MEELDFSIEQNLQHILVEEGEREEIVDTINKERKKCEVCSKTFQNETNLLQHKKKFHYIDDDDSSTTEILKSEIIEVIVKYQMTIVWTMTHGLTPHGMISVV